METFTRRFLQAPNTARNPGLCSVWYQYTHTHGTCLHCSGRPEPCCRAKRWLTVLPLPSQLHTEFKRRDPKDASITPVARWHRWLVQSPASRYLQNCLLKAAKKKSYLRKAVTPVCGLTNPPACAEGVKCKDARAAALVRKKNQKQLRWPAIGDLLKTLLYSHQAD